MDISARASSLPERPRLGYLGHQCSHAPGRPNLHLVSSSRRPRQVNNSITHERLRNSKLTGLKGATMGEHAPGDPGQLVSECVMYGRIWTPPDCRHRHIFAQWTLYSRKGKWPSAITMFALCHSRHDPPSHSVTRGYVSIRSTHCARQALASKGSAKYCVSRATLSPLNSMMLTV